MLQNDDRYSLFVNEFSSLLKELVKDKEFSNLVFLCVGTDRVTGDSFGPLVGYKLKTLFKDTKKVKVLGSLESIVSASNVISVSKEIEDDSFIIAIDSAISNTKKVGSIIVRDSSLILGKGLGKQILKIGDMSIKGVVGKNMNNPNLNFNLLQNIPLSIVMRMADVVANGIYDVIEV